MDQSTELHLESPDVAARVRAIRSRLPGQPSRGTRRPCKARRAWSCFRASGDDMAKPRVYGRIVAGNGGEGKVRSAGDASSESGPQRASTRSE